MVEHVDPDVLALVALGEPAGDDVDRAHLAACTACADELAALSAAVATGRAVTPDDALVAPPAAVWERIRGELGLSADLVPGSAPVLAVVPDLASSTPVPSTPASSTPAQLPVPVAPSEPTPLRRAPRFPWIAAAAAAGLVVGAAGGAWWMRDDGTSPAAPPVVASASLEPLPGWSQTGTAVVEEEPDGSRVLVLSVDGEIGADGFREVWLIDRDVTRLVSLGVLEGSNGRFTIPGGLDLDDFAVVDVSEEAIDGDPAHSGDSIVRGVLGA